MFDPDSPSYLPRNVSHSFGKYDTRVRVSGVVKHRRFDNKFDTAAFVDSVIPEQQKAHTERLNVLSSNVSVQSHTRDSNMTSHGHVSLLEGNFAMLLQYEIKYIGIEVLILNEFTTPDVIARVCGTADLWVPIQLKTCSHPSRRRDGAYELNKVNGYDSMPIVAFCKSDEKLWLFDGGYFGKQVNVCVTLRGKHDKRTSFCKIAEYIKSTQPSVTELQAREWMRSANHLEEYRRMMKWKPHFLLQRGSVFSFPDGQNLV
jgi:hypothetical protein